MVLPGEPQVPSTKEKKGAKPSALEKEKYPVVERPETIDVGEIPKEIEGVESVSGEVTLPKPVTGDTGAVVLDDTTPKTTTVAVPLTDEEVERALHLKVVNSIRWLAEWTKRVLKKAKGKIIYKPKIKNQR